MSAKCDAASTVVLPASTPSFHDPFRREHTCVCPPPKLRWYTSPAPSAVSSDPSWFLVCHRGSGVSGVSFILRPCDGKLLLLPGHPLRHLRLPGIRHLQAFAALPLLSLLIVLLADLRPDSPRVCSVGSRLPGRTAALPPSHHFPSSSLKNSQSLVCFLPVPEVFSFFCSICLQICPEAGFFFSSSCSSSLHRVGTGFRTFRAPHCQRHPVALPSLSKPPMPAVPMSASVVIVVFPQLCFAPCFSPSCSRLFFPDCHCP